jgi:hypothetical protein
LSRITSGLTTEEAVEAKLAIIIGYTGLVVLGCTFALEY